MVGKKGLAAAAWPQDKFVAVGDGAALHRKVGNVHMHRDAVLPVRHADTERAGRVPVIGLPGKEADRLLQKGVERLFGRKVARIAGDARPVEHRGIDGVVPRRAFHHGELAARIVPDTAELVRILGPGDDVAVAPDGQQPFGVRLIQVHFRPLLVHRVAPAVFRQREHIARVLLHHLQYLLRAVDEHILRIDMVARQQQPHGGGKGQPAVAPVRGHTLVAHVGGELARQVLRVREGMQAEPFVADTHPSGFEADVLEHGGPVLQREGEILLHQPGMFLRAGHLVRLQAAQPYVPGIVHDALELFHRLKETLRRLLVGYLLGQQEAAAEGVEVALPAVALTGGLRQVQVASVVQERSFVEVPLIAARKEALFLPAGFRAVGLLDEPVLLAHHAVFGQYLYGLYPGGVHGLVLVCRHRVQFGQFHLESHGQVGILAHDAAVLHRQQGELAFQRFRFQYISHGCFFFLFVNNLKTLLR